MGKNIRKITIFILLVFMLALFSGCSTNDGNGRDNSLASYSFEDIQVNGLGGFFVLNEDGTFSPIATDLPGETQTEIDSEYQGGYVWFTDRQRNISDTIPTVTQKTPLVFIYGSDNEFPTSWYINKYEDRGYTIGCHVSLGDDKSMYIITEDVLSGTSAEEYITANGSDSGSYELKEVSGSEKLPVNNVDPYMEVLIGLEEGKIYSFDYFQGTILKRMSCYADTRIFECVESTPIPNPYKQTTHGYFIVNLPINMTEGYYYFSGIGMFRYEERR